MSDTVPASNEFGELRSLLQRVPSRERWDALCVLLLGWWDEAHRDAVAVPYARDILERWPDQLRTLPVRWLHALETDPGLKPFVGLARALTVDRRVSEASLEELVDAEVFSSITRVDVVARSLDARRRALELLAKAPHAGAWRHFGVHTEDVEAARIEEVLTRPCCAELESLALTRKNLSHGSAVEGRDELVEVLEELQTLERVTTLSLAHDRLDARALARLARAPLMRRVVDLDLSENSLGEDLRSGLGALRTLARAPGERLRRLVMHKVELMRQDFQALVEAERFAQLEELYVSGSVPVDGVDALLTGDTLPRLRALGLKLGPVGDGMWFARKLVRSDMLEHLTHLELRECYLGETGGHALFREGELGQLEALNISDTSIGDIGVEQLSRSTKLKRLTHLWLEGVGMTDQGARMLARATSLTRLTHLNLAENALTPDGMRALAKAPWWGGLAALDVRMNTWGEGAASELAQEGLFDHLEMVYSGADVLGTAHRRLAFPSPSRQWS
ncbi:MAG: hypothetical protein AAGI01_05720 [Myxococcota bacterium]